jgi:hypothetical protein
MERVIKNKMEGCMTSPSREKNSQNSSRKKSLEYSKKKEIKNINRYDKNLI